MPTCWTAWASDPGPPSEDGNKPFGWLATVGVLRAKHVELEAPGDDAYDLIVAIASSAGTGVVAHVQLATSHYLTADADGFGNPAPSVTDAGE